MSASSGNEPSTAAERVCEPETPLRVAIVGNGRSARFYSECLRLDVRFDVVPLSADELADADLSLFAAVFVLNCPAERTLVIENCLSRGGAVVSESPVCLPPFKREQLGALVATSSTSPRLFVLRRGVDDPDFRRVRQVVADGEAGVARGLDYQLQQMGAFFLPEDPDAPSLSDSPPPVELEHGVLTAFGPDLLAQTLVLISQPVVRLFAKLSQVRPEFGPVNGPPGISRVASCPADVDTGFRVWLEFEGGKTAQLCVDLAAHADVTTGWTLQTTRGGYRQSKQVLTEPDGEIYDVPVEFESSSLLDAVTVFLGAKSSKHGVSATGGVPDSLFSLQTELRVLSLLDVIRESDRTQQAVTCLI
ncbi:hypothetical protein GC176_18730 [bacterium]|nr:hypothetical protein [bacterium]